MSDKLLTENCIFTCSVNPAASFRAKEGANTVGREKSYRFLTKSASLSLSSIGTICPKLTELSGGAPEPCQYSPTVWSHFNSCIQFNRTPVLTDKSSIRCVYGGKLIPRVSQSISSTGAVVNIEDMSSSLTDLKRETTHFGAVKDSTVEGREDTHADTRLAEDSVDNRSAETEAETALDLRGVQCNYENCDRREKCPYLMTPLSVMNRSDLLRKNYIKERPDEWKSYQELHTRKLSESENGSWRTAAHHIISGKQVLMMAGEQEGELQYASLIRLANFFGYDINNAVNCILLPSNADNWGEKDVLEKTASAFDVMGYMGRQWHVGGHAYSVSQEMLDSMKAYYEKHPELYPHPGGSQFFQNYQSALKEEMDKLALRYSRKKCWMRRRGENKEKFFNDMNGLSRRVEDFLLRFSTNPKRSFPFYVSRSAAEYAYGIKKTEKMIMVYRDENHKLHAKRFRMTRNDGDKLKVIPRESQSMAVEDTAEGIKEFIIFCENVMFFLVDASSGWELPFAVSDEGPYKNDIHLGTMKPAEYMAVHGNELMVWAQSKDLTYQPIAKIVRMRLKEMENVSIYSEK